VCSEREIHSWTQRCVVRYEFTDVSQKYTVSIFSVQDQEAREKHTEKKKKKVPENSALYPSHRFENLKSNEK
jgi:hypothetical protein